MVASVNASSAHGYNNISRKQIYIFAYVFVCALGSAIHFDVCQKEPPRPSDVVRDDRDPRTGAAHHSHTHAQTHTAERQPSMDLYNWKPVSSRGTAAVCECERTSIVSALFR